MNGRIGDSSETIDGKISRSICDAIGARLRQNLRPEVSNMPERIRRLMEELERRDARD
ncbi:MAG: hypothetical protein ACRECL_20205 [Bradyrhizobium sp.]